MARDNSRFQHGISYTPGKANVMADALSRKAYCSELEFQIQQPLLYEELRKMTIEIVPQGHVNSLVVEPYLVERIKIMQRFDADIDAIKCYLSKGKLSFFNVADDGTLYFKDRLV